MESLSAQVRVVGGGPAGMAAGVLLARAGVAVAVLETTAISCGTSAATPSIPRLWT